MENKYFSKSATYARLNDILLSLGYKRYRFAGGYEEELEVELPQGTVYLHEDAGAKIMLPIMTPNTKLNWAYQSMAASNVYGCGILGSKEEFNAMITAPAEENAVRPPRKPLEKPLEKSVA